MDELLLGVLTSKFFLVMVRNSIGRKNLVILAWKQQGKYSFTIMERYTYIQANSSNVRILSLENRIGFVLL